MGFDHFAGDYAIDSMQLQAIFRASQPINPQAAASLGQLLAFICMESYVLGMSHIPTVRRVDHFAYTVPELDSAIGFFTELLGGELCYVEGPVRDPDPHGDRMLRKLGVHPRAEAHVAMVRVGATTNLELFRYTAPGRRHTPPRLHEPGGHRLAFLVEDVDALAARLRDRPGVRIHGDATAPTCEPGRSLRRLSFSTPWGMELQVCGESDPRTAAAPRRPAGPATVLGTERLTLAVTDLDAAVRFFTRVVGAAEDGMRCRWLGPGDQRRALLRLGPTDRIELREVAGDPAAAPRNHDAGGYHIAFHADDVDAAAAYLAAQPGVRVMGDPETIGDGPIAGNRWVYFATPVGVQMEVLCMPDGQLPYERLTLARRVSSRDAVWG